MPEPQTAPTRVPPRFVVALILAPVLVASATGACGGNKTPPATGGVGGEASASASASSPAADGGAAPEATPTPTTTSTDGGVPLGDATSLVLATATGDDAAADAPKAPPCWKGFVPTGNAVNDVVELGRRCAAGMVQLFPPVKHTFRAPETKRIPVAFVPGCYRIIAVGGTGVKDVDLELRDNAGRLVAADATPDDVFPMIHPNKELCVDAVQFLTLAIIVKKGSGEVAGDVWKR